MFYGSELVDDVSLLISDSNMINNVINRLPIRSPENTGKLIVVGLYDARENVDVETAESKYWNVMFVYPIAIYTFRSDVDTLPDFDAWYTYEYTDVDNGNGTITRTIGAETYPLSMSFYQKTALRSVEFLDTRQLTSMSQMFYYVQELEYVNGDGWDTSNVTDMNQMFYYCTGLTTISNISNWDTSNVTNMNQMFNFCKKLKSIDIRDWDVSKVTNMTGMLCQCVNLTTVRMDNVDLTNVTTMTQFFSSSTKIDSVTISSNVDSINKIIELLLTRSISSPGTLNIGLFDKSEVDHASAEAKYWNVVEGVLIKYKFNKSIDTMPVFNEEFNYDYRDLDNGDGTAMRKIVSSVQDELPSIISFKDKTGLIELYRINIDNVTDMSYMFANCVNLLSINGTEDWNISDVENMNNMFDNCPKLSELNFNGWSINGSTDNMLNEAEDLVKVRMMVSDHRSVNSIIDELPTRSADDIGTMIVVGSSRIESIDHAKANSKYWNVILKAAVTYKFNSYESIYPTFNEDFEYDVIDRIESETITERYIVNYDNVVPTQISFESQNNLLDVVDMDISGLNNTDGMFSECEQLTHVNFSGFNNKVENMQGMFYYCDKLTSIEGLNKFDTSNVTDMNCMFYGCSNLTSIDLSSFNTSKVTDMNNMFYNCEKLTSLDLSSFNTGAVTAMYSMFYQCTNLTSIDLSGWDTSNVTDMSFMFCYCDNLTSLDVGSFNTSKVTAMNNMFAGCHSLRSLNLNNFEINDDTICVYLLAETDLSYIKANNCGPETINALIREVPSANYTNRRIIYNLNNTDFNNIFKKHSDSKNWKICIRRGYRKNNITIGERYL
jgi:surface protein